MEILYVLTNIILFGVVLLTKRKDTKIDLFSTIAVVVVLKFCYNVLICYIDNLIKVPITLLTLSVQNLLFSGIFIFKIIRTREVQKYSFDKKDGMFLIIIAIVFFTLVWKIYGFPIAIRYYSFSDFVNHLSYSLNFSNKTELLNSFIRPGAYVNTGILFKVLAPFVDTFDLYKVYILGDMIWLVMQSIMMYILSKKYIKNIFSFIIVAILSVLFILSYPLNSILFGFSYLSLAMLMIITLGVVMEKHEDGELPKWTWWGCLALINFGIAFSYYFLLPFIYLSIFIYKLFETLQKNKKVISMENIIFSLIVFVVPAIASIQYHFLSRIIKSGTESLVKQATLEGAIHNSLYANFLLLLPFIAYYIYKEIVGLKRKKLTDNKDKNIFRSKMDFSSIMVLSTLFYIIVTFIVNRCGLLSDYGFFKTYYAFWLFAFCVFIKGIFLLLNQKGLKKYLTMVFMIFYIIVASYKFICPNLRNFVKDFRGVEGVQDCFELFENNGNVIKRTDYFYNTLECDLIKFVYENIDLENDKILLYTFCGQNEKFFNIFYKTNKGIGFNSKEYNQTRDNGLYKYILYMGRSLKKHNIKREEVADKMILLYENSSGAVYENPNYNK
ncbi:MAG: hypothetical protein Q4G05_02865 [Clostridia bacterium]|nr:hypothetical protein [Clostridia bacterium]